jgi:hypothetical protein
LDQQALTAFAQQVRALVLYEPAGALQQQHGPSRAWCANCCCSTHQPLCSSSDACRVFGSTRQSAYGVAKAAMLYFKACTQPVNCTIMRYVHHSSACQALSI